MRGKPARAALLIAPFAAPLLLAGCQPGGRTGDDATQAAGATASDDTETGPAPDDTVVQKSIIRAEVDTTPPEAPVLKPSQVVVPYPAKGAEPDAAGRAVMDRLIMAPAVLAGGPITIWGHSDSQGADAANLAASRRRAESARDYLVGKGIAGNRITIVPLGESRPVAPNRNLDGSDDQEGRARNRRVEIRADLPPPPTIQPEQPPAVQP